MCRFSRAQLGNPGLARDGEMCVTEAQMGVEDLGIGGSGETRMKFPEPLGHFRIARGMRLAQVFGLILKMIETRIRWEGSYRHDELPFAGPRSAFTGRK